MRVRVHDCQRPIWRWTWLWAAWTAAFLLAVFVVLLAPPPLSTPRDLGDVNGDAPILPEHNAVAQSESMFDRCYVPWPGGLSPSKYSIGGNTSEERVSFARSLWHSPQTSDYLLVATEGTLAVLWILLAFGPRPIHPTEEGGMRFTRTVTVTLHSRTAFAVAFAVVWYLSTHWLVNVGKVILGDYRCLKTRANSVSGHTAFHFFHALTAAYLVTRLDRNPRIFAHYFSSPSRRHTFSRLLLGVMFLFWSLSLLTLWRTWSLGYHTLRQMAYGLLAASASHTMLIALLENRRISGTQALRILALFGLSSFVVVMMWTGSIHLSPSELAIAGAMVILLIISRQHHSHFHPSAFERNNDW